MRTRERLALRDDEDNPYLIALVLAAFYVVDAPRTGLLGPGAAADRTPAVAAVGEAEALLDLAGPPGTVALRVIAPVEQDDGLALNAAVELRWGGLAPASRSGHRRGGGWYGRAHGHRAPAPAPHAAGGARGSRRRSGSPRRAGSRGSGRRSTGWTGRRRPSAGSPTARRTSAWACLDRWVDAGGPGTRR